MLSLRAVTAVRLLFASFTVVVGVVVAGALTPPFPDPDAVIDHRKFTKVYTFNLRDADREIILTPIWDGDGGARKRGAWLAPARHWVTCFESTDADADTVSISISSSAVDHR
jgi:hypothetical protein